MSTILSLVYCLSFSYAVSSSDSTVIPKDFKNMVGCWNGTLTYLDYSTNKPFSMPANMIVKDFKRSKNITYSLIYPKEPRANSYDTLFISKDGRFVNKEAISTRNRLHKDSIEIVTEMSGIDGNDNKTAIIRHTYLLGKNTYTVRKEVRFQGQTQWILRNEYKFIRVNLCG
jgi:hypothetical protein